jgi:hypothetical protein
MFREINAKSITIAVAIVSATVWTTFVGTRLFMTYSLDWRLTKLELQVKGLEGRLATEERQLQFLYDRLVDVTFDTAMAASSAQNPKAKPTVESWQKNRDEELRRRLLALEQWRLQQQGRSGR